MYKPNKTVKNIVLLVSIQIVANGDTPSVGKNYSLICQAPGAKDVSYEWRKAGDHNILQSSGGMLSFSSLRLTDAGKYTCVILNYTMFNDSEIVRLKSKCTIILRYHHQDHCVLSSSTTELHLNYK